jgi:RimJ/RimL family protein N-acetyltransferase
MQSQSPIFLKGRKVNLRPVLKGDLDRCMRWVNDPSIRDFLMGYFPYTQYDEEKWIKEISEDTPYSLTLAIETVEGQHIGQMGLHRINWRDRVAITGALIGEAEFRDKGYGSEAKIILLHHAFRSMNLRKICSQAVALNLRSIAYSKKCGYLEEGRLKKHVFRQGKYYDLVQLAVYWKNFKSIWNKYQGGSN